MAGRDRASGGPTPTGQGRLTPRAAAGAESANPDGVITHSNRGVELLLRAIRSVETFDELARLRALIWENYAANALLFGDLMAEVERRIAVLQARLEQGEIFAGGAGE